MSGPANGWPESPRFSTIGSAIARCSALAWLSPVHAAAQRWPPRKFARESTNGRRPGAAAFTPSHVACAMSMPYTLW